jgi:hypothetical protein
MFDFLRPENLVAIGVAVTAFAAIVTLAAPMMGGNRLEGGSSPWPTARTSCAAVRVSRSPPSGPAAASASVGRRVC